MKNFPYPDKRLKDTKEVERHYATLVNNALEHLNIDGYSWNILLPGEDGFQLETDAGASVHLNYPYKRFAISLQQDSIDKALSASLDSGFWPNAERSMFHECIHILTWRISLLAEKRYVTQREITEADEELTDHIAVMFYALLKDWRKEKDATITKAKKRKKSK